MRGRTLNDSFVILDEAQNTTTEQMKMFLTRLGYGSKAVITGDVTQVDLPAGKASGLQGGAARSCATSRASASSRFTERDVVRHPLVQEIIAAYERAVSRSRCRAGRRSRSRRAAGACRALARGSARRGRAPAGALATPRCGAVARAGVRRGDATAEPRLARQGPSHRRARRSRRPRAPGGAPDGPARRRRHLRRHRAPPGGRARGAARRASSTGCSIHGRAAPARLRPRALAGRGAAHAAPGARARAARSTREADEGGRWVTWRWWGRTAPAPRSAVAEAPRRRFGVPLAVLSGLCLAAAFPVAGDRAARVDRPRAAAARHPRPLAGCARSGSAGSRAPSSISRPATGSSTPSGTTPRCRVPVAAGVAAPDGERARLLSRRLRRRRAPGSSAAVCPSSGWRRRCG